MNKKNTEITQKTVDVFRREMASLLGMKIVIVPSVFEKILIRWLNRVTRGYMQRLGFEPALRPACVRNLVVLPSCFRVLPPLEQMLIIVHECQHWCRIKEYPARASRWYAEYFTKPTFRIREESDAMIAVAEVAHYIGSRNTNCSFRGYALGFLERTLATSVLKESFRFVEKGQRGYSQHLAAGIAIKILIDLNY